MARAGDDSRDERTLSKNGSRSTGQRARRRSEPCAVWRVADRANRFPTRARAGSPRELYEGRLKRNLNTASAVREASLAILRARRAAGQSTDPFYWAAFVAAGDWR